MQDEKMIRILHDRNMVFPVVNMSHNELLEKLFYEYSLSSKAKIVESFLLGLEHGKPEKRAALSAYAIMMNFPKHNYTEGVVTCKVCDASKNEIRDFTVSNLERYTTGSTYSGSPEDLYFFLKENNCEISVGIESVSVLNNILDVLRCAQPKETPNKIESKVRGVPSVNMNKDQVKGLLNLLGHIGVLEAPDHKGFIHKYKNIGLMPRKSRSSDWSYPVDFWKGEYGVNEEAVEFWFGDYLRKFK